MQSGKATLRRARLFITVAEIDLASLGPVLPSRLEARRLYGDKGGMAIQFLEVMDSDAGSFLECTLSVVCKQACWPTCEQTGWCTLPGLPVWIGVTSDLARRYGRERWGYPKDLADLSIAFAGDRFRGHAVSPIGVSVECSATLTGELEVSDVELRSVSRRGDDLLFAPLVGSGKLATTWDPQAQYRLDLRAIGLGESTGTSTMGVYAEDLSLELRDLKP